MHMISSVKSNAVISRNFVRDIYSPRSPLPDCCVDEGPWRAGDGHRGGAEEPPHCAQHQ